MFITFETSTTNGKTYLRYRFNHEKDIKQKRRPPYAQVEQSSGQYRIKSFNDTIKNTKRPTWHIDCDRSLNITNLSSEKIKELKSNIITGVKDFYNKVNAFNQKFDKTTKYTGRFVITSQSNIKILPKGKRIKLKTKQKTSQSTKSKTYRIKTEKEFIIEFGSNWRNIVRHTFPTSMDNLLNRVLTKEEYEKIGIDKCHIGGYTVGQDMIITIEPKKTSQLNKNTA